MTDDTTGVEGRVRMAMKEIATAVPALPGGLSGLTATPARRHHPYRALMWLSLAGLSAATLLGIVVARNSADSELGSEPQSSDDIAATTPTPPLEQVDGKLTLQSILARNGPEGTERVVLVFDGDPPPQLAVMFPDDATANSAVLSVSTDDGGSVTLCGNAHGGDVPPSISLGLPAAWFASDPSITQADIKPDPSRGDEYFASLSKIITCPAIDGVVQVAVMNPVSIEPNRISVIIDDNTIILEVSNADGTTAGSSRVLPT